MKYPTVSAYAALCMRVTELEARLPAQEQVNQYDHAEITARHKEETDALRTEIAGLRQELAELKIKRRIL